MGRKCVLEPVWMAGPLKNGLCIGWGRQGMGGGSSYLQKLMGKM